MFRILSYIGFFVFSPLGYNDQTSVGRDANISTTRLLHVRKGMLNVLSLSLVYQKENSTLFREHTHHCQADWSLIEKETLTYQSEPFSSRKIVKWSGKYGRLDCNWNVLTLLLSKEIILKNMLFAKKKKIYRRKATTDAIKTFVITEQGMNTICRWSRWGARGHLQRNYWWRSTSWN